MPELKKEDLIEEEYEEREEGAAASSSGAGTIASNLADFRNLFAAVALQVVFYYLASAGSHRWGMIIVLILIWFFGLCVAAAELFSESVLRKFIAFLVLVSFIYTFFKLLLYIISVFR